MAERALVSVVMPVFNEREFLARAVDAVERAALPEGVSRELLVVDDGSSDGTAERLRKLAAERPALRALYHRANRGKGAAVRTGFAETRGDFVLVQDADLEYDPAEYPALLAPLLDGRADAVFGSRFFGATHRVLYFWHYAGNRGLTLLSNMLSNLNLSDMECCYKVLHRRMVDRLVLEEDRFGIEPEITAKVARLGGRIYEVPISYSGRTYAEGKKIDWKDGFSALRCILKYNLRPGAWGPRR